MAKTVDEAFNIFLRDYVNLDPDKTQLAKSSRDWLLSNIHLFPSRDMNFPNLYSEKDIFFGSFPRRTKKRELDDIDIMIAFRGEGGYYREYANHIEIYIPNSANQLKLLCFDYTNILNSRKLINKLISLLNQVPQYQNAEIKRNLEAATLSLKSYPWNFDLVPCFFTQKDNFNKDYYLIPDGNGHWKKTDPRIDKNRVTTLNQYHNGNILNPIRLMKYWNEKPMMFSMPSYLIENIILDFYSKSVGIKASKYSDLEVRKLLNYIQNNIFYSVNDPKEIQGDINTLEINEKTKIYTRAKSDYFKALQARELEKSGDYKSSIMKWREIFGVNFPTYF